MTQTARNISEIDPNDLVTECIKLPAQYQELAEQLARARQQADAAKNLIDATKAQLDQDIRANPDEYDLPKVTETAVAAAVMVHPRYQKAVQAAADSRYLVDMLQAATSALEHKRRMIESLVSLHGQSYFTAVRPRDQAGREALEEAKHANVAARTARAIQNRTKAT